MFLSVALVYVRYGNFNSELGCLLGISNNISATISFTSVCEGQLRFRNTLSTSNCYGISSSTTFSRCSQNSHKQFTNTLENIWSKTHFTGLSRLLCKRMTNRQLNREASRITLNEESQLTSVTVSIFS